MKKNLQRIVAIIAAFMVGIGASAFTNVVNLKEEITSIEELKAGKFILQSPDGKILYIPSGWDIKVANPVDAIASETNGGCFALEALGDNYLLHTYKFNGEGHYINESWYKGDGYMNAQPTGDVIFALGGKDGRHGQDGDNLAVWTITYTEGNGFVFHNVGRDIYLGLDAAAARPSTTPVYWKAFKSFEKTVDYVEGEDITSLAGGWKTDMQGGLGAVGDWAWPGHGGSPEIYNGGAAWPAGNVLYQSMENMKEGLYEVELEAVGSKANGVASFAGENLSEIFVNACSQPITVEERNTVAGDYPATAVIKAAVLDGKLQFGVRNLAPAGNWYVIRLNKITYVSEYIPAPAIVSPIFDPEDEAAVDPNEVTSVKITFPLEDTYKGKDNYTIVYKGTVAGNGEEIPFQGETTVGGVVEVDVASIIDVNVDYTITIPAEGIQVLDKTLDDEPVMENKEAYTSTFRTATLTELAIKEYETAVEEADALALHASTHIGVGVMLYLPAKVAQYKKDLALAKSLASNYKIYNDYKEGTALINFLVRELQPQYPEINQRYLVQHKASGLYLNADDGVKLNAAPTPVAFHHVEGAKEESRYFMYSTPDREYICYEGSNPWTMTNKTVSIEGGKFIIKHHCDLDPAGVRKNVYYSLVGMNGVLGSNADLAKDAGIYGDKKEGDANAQWLLIPYEEPDPSDMSVKPTPKTTALATDGNTIQYLYNAEADAFFTQGNAWGTQASYLPTVGNQFKVSIAGGTTEIINLVPNKNNAWMNPFIDAQGGIYVDNGGDPNSHAWSINVLEDGSFEITNTIVATDKKVGIDPAEKKNIIQMTNAEGAYTKWFAVSEEDFNAYVMARLAYDKWVKENTTIQPGDDVTYLADGAAFTSALGTPGTVADWAWSGHEGAAELYNQGAINAGDVLVMSLSDIQNGVYDVTLEVAASFTPGRGFEAPVGEGLAEAFANSATEAIEVFERESVGADGADVVTLTAVVTDGTLKFGVRNLASAGNWFLCDLKSIVFVSKDVKSVLIKTPEATEISSVSSSAAPAAIYSVNGAQLKSMQKGMNIVKMADGSVKKVLVK